MATTLTEQGSAGRTPTSVEKILDDSKSQVIAIHGSQLLSNYFEYCKGSNECKFMYNKMNKKHQRKLHTYSHSDVTANIEDEKDCRRLLQANGPNVPPLWLTMMTIGSLSPFISSVLAEKGKPSHGMASSCPKRPSSLLLLTHFTNSWGKDF